MTFGANQVLLAWERPLFAAKATPLERYRRHFALKDDPYLRVFFPIFVILNIPYFLPFFSDVELRWHIGFYVDLLFLPLVIWAFQNRLSLIDDARERRFWNCLTLGFLCWWVARLCVIVPESWWKADNFLTVSGIHMLSYLAFFFAAEGRPHSRAGGVAGARSQRMLQSAGVMVLVFGFLVYFVLIPSRLNPSVSSAWIPSSHLYLALDLLLAIRFAWLFGVSRRLRWRVVYGLLSVTAGLWAGLDLLAGLARTGALAGFPGSRMDLLWSLPILTIVLAARLRHHRFREDEQGKAQAGSHSSRHPFRSPLLLAAFTFPVIHFGFYSFGLLDDATRPARGVVVFLGLLVLGAMAVVEHEFLEKRSIRAERQRRRAERKRQRAEAEAERRKLEARIRHAQKLRSLGMLAGGVAHEFNNLLTAILGNAELARIALPSDSPVHNFIREMTEAGWRAAELSQQMQTYAGGTSVVAEHLDLSELIEATSPLLRTTITGKAKVNYQLCSALPPVKADAVQLRQVVVNLVTNALEALSGKKKGLILIGTGVVDCDSARLSKLPLGEYLRAGRYVYLEISDTGCGIDRETREQIFDPFFTSKCAGRGLGLAATLGIVRSHQGTIEVASEPGYWSSVRVLFPASEWLAEDVVPGELPPDDWSAKGATILAVDDEENVRMLTAAMLEMLDCRVLMAADGHEGVEVFRQHAEAIDLVLLDQKMPSMCGDEAFREIRRIRSDTRVVICSGLDEYELARRFAGNEPDGFLRKPYELKKLREKLHEVLPMREDGPTGTA